MNSHSYNYMQDSSQKNLILKELLMTVHCKSSMFVLTTNWLLMLCSVRIMLVMQAASSATHKHVSSKNGAVMVEN